MNLMLIRGGYPPVAVRPEDCKPYLDATLGEYLSTLQGPLPQPDPNR
jgi:hypothetical protein